MWIDIRRCGALIAVVLAGCGGSTPGKTKVTCEAAAECDAVAAGKGQLCIASECSACSSDAECREVAYYGAASVCVEGRCVGDGPCNPGDPGCSCLGDGTCFFSKVCDATAELCRDPLDCATASCAPHQRCQAAANGADASCLAECEPGYSWTGADPACVAVPSNCRVGDSQSILSQCTAENRECVESGEQASCGSCLSGFEDNGAGSCMAPVSCATLLCEEQQFRGCVTAGSVPECTGPCIEGYVEDLVLGACRERITCATLTCETDEVCTELPQDDAYCLPVNMDVCDAAELHRPCPAGQAWSRKDSKCVSCNCPAGPSQTGEVYPLLTAEPEKCICVPPDGYYYDEGAVHNKKCDADGDGWVSINARNLVESQDCVRRRAAKCDVRVIDQFVFHDDEGSAPRVVSPSPSYGADDWLPALSGLVQGQLALYETEANDTYEVRGVGGASAVPLVPYYTTGGDEASTRRPSAAELNSLTKACGSLTTSGGSFDHNDNGVEDLLEWQGQATYSSGTKDWQKPFVHFSYYIELYEGWYEGPKSFREGVGTYHIREKSRQDVLPLHYTPSAGGEYWRDCRRRRDSEYLFPPDATQPNRGMDFARFSSVSRGGAVGGMGHHSQFKCVLLADSGYTYSRAAPEVISVAEASQRYVVNACHMEPGSRKLGPNPADKNPSDPSFACLPVTPAEGQLALVAAKFDGAEAALDQAYYTQGCLDECNEMFSFPPSYWCPGYEVAGVRPPRIGCVTNERNFGEAVCGCLANYAGPACSIGCPSNKLLHNIGSDPETKLRTGHWLCGDTSAGGGASLGAGSSYKAHGAVSAPSTTRNVLEGNGYTLR